MWITYTPIYEISADPNVQEFHLNCIRFEYQFTYKSYRGKLLIIAKGGKKQF